MSDRETPRTVAQPDEDRQTDAERWELLAHLQRLLEPMMAALGIVFLILLIIDFAGISAEQQPWLDRAMTAIWVAFVVDFLLRLVIAPSKPSFLRENWLSVASLALPFLRPLRALRAIRAARSLRLVRLLGGANRGMRVLQRVTGGQQIAYVGALTILVTLLGAVGVLFFDRNVEGATIRTFGDAIWWSTAMITTINNEKYAVSPEARVIAVLQRVFAVSIFGLVTAAIASYLVGRQVDEQASASNARAARDQDTAAIHAELVALRQELATLRTLIELTEPADKSPRQPPTAAAANPGPAHPTTGVLPAGHSTADAPT